jgi:iron(III) transport system substrate-binding protein
MRKLLGEEETADWLKAMVANGVKTYPKNAPQILAASTGEIDIGLVNHYYLHRYLSTEGEGFSARNHYMGSGGAGSLIMVSGVGILSTSTNPVAEHFVKYLLSKEIQQRFAIETYEYPVIPGIPINKAVTPIEKINNPSIEASDLVDLKGTLQLLRDSGVIP